MATYTITIDNSVDAVFIQSLGEAAAGQPTDPAGLLRQVILDRVNAFNQRQAALNVASVDGSTVTVQSESVNLSGPMPPVQVLP